MDHSLDQESLKQNTARRHGQGRGSSSGSKRGAGIEGRPGGVQGTGRGLISDEGNGYR